MTDIRLILGFFDHPKTLKLKRKLGFDGVESLIRLWQFTAMSRPKGVLTGLSMDDIEAASKWSGEPGAFVAELLDIGWLDVENDSLAIHDWQEHQPWVWRSPERREIARKAIHSRWHKPKDPPAVDTKALFKAISTIGAAPCCHPGCLNPGEREIGGRWYCSNPSHKPTRGYDR